MENLKSEHWTNDGTGLTNFGPEDFDRYNEAVSRYGSDKFVVSTERMIGRGEGMAGGSLHYKGDLRSAEGQDDVHRFWIIFDQVTQALKAAA